MMNPPLSRLAVLLALLAACGSEGERDADGSVDGSADGGPTPDAAAIGYDWRLPPGFPRPRVPAENPMTTEKVALGRRLFYDVRLSGNGTQSCGSCHQQALAFTDGRARGVGSTGQVHPRGAMGLVNVAYASTLTWANPALTRLEQQIALPLFGENPIEMGVTGNEEIILARLRGDAVYPALFTAAFAGDADPIRFAKVIAAIASFMRSLIAGQSPFDRFSLQGDKTALDASAVRGMDLFFSERFECFHCHGGFNLSSSVTHENSGFAEIAFHNTGLYNVGNTGAYPFDNQGLFEFTGNTRDMGKFRAPSLRNITLTAPYMHDGSIASLPEVLEFYAAGGRLIESGPHAGDGRKHPNKSRFMPGFTMTAEEKADLLAFLQSLTDPAVLTDTRFSDPFAAKP